MHNGWRRNRESSPDAAPADGPDAIYFLNQQNYPIEFAEQNYPLVMKQYAINCDSGGPGRWRGGCGVIREFEMRSSTASISLRMSNVDWPAYGVAGGMCGRSGRFTLNPGRLDEKILPSLIDGVVLHNGDVLQIAMPGGGGYGHPFDREPEFVLADVLAGIVSPESALAEYGVVLDTEAECVDTDATQAYRASHRWPTSLFHRCRYFDVEQWLEHVDQATRSRTPTTIS